VGICVLSVNAENEEKVLARQENYQGQGGRFVSIHPPSDRLPDFWREFGEKVS
jgi:hypothetical protein